MTEDRDRAVDSCDAGRSCADWALPGAGLSPGKFAALGPEVRRMALVQRSARFAAEFARWKDAGRAGGIGYEHMRLLQSLNFGGPAIMREVGDKLLVTPRNMTAMVDQLEQADLVARRPHPADRRATLLELTPAGRQMADSALPSVIAMGEIFDRFSEEEQQGFYAALGSLIEAMRGAGHAAGGPTGM